MFNIYILTEQKSTKYCVNKEDSYYNPRTKEWECSAGACWIESFTEILNVAEELGLIPSKFKPVWI